jgi:hypothetical protein
MILALGNVCAVTFTFSAAAHETSPRGMGKITSCSTATFISDKVVNRLSTPYNERPAFAKLQTKPIWKSVISNLWVNIDKARPCFANSDTPIWGKVVSRIPADVVGLEVANDLDHAMVYVTGIPDYTMETPKLFAGFKPGNIYGAYKISAEPKPDTRSLHEFASKGAIGIFVNGVNIFNYTDTFSYNDKGAWTYDANVAEATIVNSDISHATPSDLPQFPKSRGIFHNHQMSRELLEQLKDPFARGVRAHSRIVGYAIDSYPIYGPLGYGSRDRSSGIKTLRSSYVKRDWIEAGKGGTGHRSSLPEWSVRNWDHGNDSVANLVNLFQKAKADMLYADKATEGPVQYTGDDAKLAAEIKSLNEKKGLKRDSQGYVYWEASVGIPNGKTSVIRNYLLKSSGLWGPDIGQPILPVSYQIADKDKFLFNALTGSFSEDYEFVSGYGDLDFFNGIESFVPEQSRAVYHYVATFSSDVSGRKRLSKAAFPYFVGIQYRGVVDPFNATLDDKVKAKYLTENRPMYKAIFDLGIIGKGEDGQLQHGFVIPTWQKALNGE